MSIATATPRFLAAAAAITAVAALSPEKAEAATPGQCFSNVQAFNQAMQAANQRIVAVGNQIMTEQRGGTIDVTGQRHVRLFTMNENTRQGYVVHGNNILGLEQSQICIEAALQNVTLFDSRIPRVQASATMDPAKRSEAQAYCATVPNMQCGFHNDILDRLNTFGERVMLQATFTGQGSREPLMLTLTAKPNDPERTGGLGITRINGATTTVGILADVDYSRHGLDILRARQ